MNGASPEMLHCHHNTTDGADVSVFERQQARMKWQQQQQEQHRLFNGDLVIKPDPDMQNGCPDFSDGRNSLQFPSLMADKGNLQKNSDSASLSHKKRKSYENQKPKVISEENGVEEKKIKGCSQENSIETSPKDKQMDAKPEKPDYIHVRARRGQATDSHSLAERVRRERISKRMKYLQDLVPGCNKITGKAGMLDEIINYVRSLQRQVEFLSMKLATVHPRLDFDIDNSITQEMFEVSTLLYSSEMANSTYFQLNSLLEIGANPIDMVLKRSGTTGTSLSIPETLVVSSCLNQPQSTDTWDSDLHNLYKMDFQQESSKIPYHFQTFTE